MEVGSRAEMHAKVYEVIELLRYGPGEKNVYLRLKECATGTVYKWPVSITCVRSVE